MLPVGLSLARHFLLTNQSLPKAKFGRAKKRTKTVRKTHTHPKNPTPVLQIVIRVQGLELRVKDLIFRVQDPVVSVWSLSYMRLGFRV